uniref:7TM_GPCR_Srx domain-containing protein n=1 Tax=Steinernema glaseri TaxID=37863 RepID=A0A1I7XVU6_9BILA
MKKRNRPALFTPKNLLEAIYIPCLVVILKTEQLRSLSCYKIMTFLGIVECFGVAVSCLFSGYLFLEGAVFCSSPHVIYFVGQLMNSSLLASGLPLKTQVSALWEAQCMLCVLLGVNRVIDFWDVPGLKTLFEGKKTFFWFVPVLCGCAYFVVFTSPPVFSSIKQQWFFDPYAGMVDVPRDPSITSFNSAAPGQRVPDFNSCTIRHETQ